LGRDIAPPREGFIRPGGSTPDSVQAMPPGGVIGGIPGRGVAQPGSMRPTTQRINPVGGVIGGVMPQSRAGSSLVSGQPVGIGGPHGHAARGSAGRGQEEQTRWDPDNPWQTASGVDPIVLPPREQRLDPGPAIGRS